MNVVSRCRRQRNERSPSGLTGCLFLCFVRFVSLLVLLCSLLFVRPFVLLVLLFVRLLFASRLMLRRMQSELCLGFYAVPLVSMQFVLGSGYGSLATFQTAVSVHR